MAIVEKVFMIMIVIFQHLKELFINEVNVVYLKMLIMSEK
jgi:hypothetical protein